MSLDISTFYSSRNVPKLFRNHRIESQWGVRYYGAVKSAVFIKFCFPYTPGEPPATLSEEIMESDSLHVCDQCKDSFRFKSSFEDHIKRRSWILGFWCQMCFITICTHKTATKTACLLCLKKDSDRRAYLRTRGFTKNQRCGTMKVFYNQCQFFKHLEMHKCNSVDLGNLVLMPLPVGLMDSDWSTELEIACEALMEHTFLSRIHINDWLRTYNLENMWWKLIDDKSNNLVCKVIKGYKGREIFRTLEESDHVTDSTFIDNILPESTCSLNSESADQNETNNNSSSTSENEDNPCTSNGIAFVDCGEAAKGFVPEFTTSYVPRTRKTVVAESQQKTIIKKIITVKDLKQIEKPNVSGNYTNVISLSNSNQKFTVDGLSEGAAVRQCTSYTITQPFLKETRFNVKSTQNTDIINQILTNNHPSTNNISAKTSITNNNSNIIQNSKTVDIASIIDQFSPSLASNNNNNNNNNKIVVIESDSHKLLIRNIDTVPIKKVSCKSNNSGTNVNVPLQTCNTKSVNKNDWQMVIRNDKKYLIKIVKNTANNVNKSNSPFVSKTIKKPSDNILTTNIDKTYDNKAANNDTEQVVSSPSNIARSTLPSSEISGSSVQKSTNTKTPTTSQSLQKKNVNHSFDVSSEEVHSDSKFDTLETVIIGLRENHFYMQVQVLDRNSVDRNIRYFTDSRRSGYSHQMINNFNQLNASELQKRLDHLENVKEELKMVLNFTPEDIILNEKLARVNTLQQMLEKCKKDNDDCRIDVKPEKFVDVKLVEWETEASKKNTRCMRCNKPKKPDMYIPGFSKLPKHDYDYCLCYKYVCHECQTYEGGMPRFVAHRNFHKKSPPFLCPDCYTRFPSAVLLEVHTWTACFHTMRKHLFCCKICNIDGFRDMESITRHFVIMHSDTKTACDICWLVFSTYSECVEHYSKEHSTRHEPIRLVVCKIGNVAVRWENYMTYLEHFRGIRKLTYFKCPFCTLITVNNKHAESLLNNHIRTQHLAKLAKTIKWQAFKRIFKIVKVIDGKTYAQASNLLPNNDTVMPKIVNTRTISSETFECGSTDCLLANSDDFSNADVTNTVRDDDDKKREESLPKILNVISMADLKQATAEKTIILPKSLSLQTDIVGDKKTDQCKDVEETPMEIEDIKFETTEETEATKKSGTINSELITPRISEKLSLKDVDDICVILPSKDDSNSKPEANTTSRIKVVDFRKICKPDVTPFIDEMRDARIEDTNSNCPIPEPPPLTKISQHTVKANEPNNDSENVARSRDLVPTVAKPKLRIAIHGTRDKDVEYKCHLCNERINTSWSVVRKHFDKKHLNECTLTAVAPRALRMSSDFINGGYKAFICGEKRKADSTLGSSLLVPKKKRRWATKKWHDAEKPAGLCVEQETAEDGEGNFKCKKCDQRCTDMSNLREHIATSHRIKNSYFICLECGENFMVTPSLQMHLKAFHGIEDPISYMNQNPLYAPGADGDSEAEGETDNQCYVCKAIFEDKAAVDKHLRVHGMAFLNRKRIEARNAQKSPEKKITEDDKQVVIKEISKNVVKQEKPLETLLEKLNAAI